MILNSCPEGDTFLREVSLWPSANQRLLAGLDPSERLAASGGEHSSWHSALVAAIGLAAGMPDDHPLSLLARSRVHVTVAEIPDVNCHASTVRIRSGCYFVGCSLAMRAALDSFSRAFTYLNHAPGGVENRYLVIRYVRSILGGVRAGEGWQQYLDLRLSLVPDEYAGVLTRLGQIQILLHELRHIALREAAAASPTVSKEARYKVETTCDVDAMEVLASQCGRMNVQPGHVVAATEVLMAAQALLDEADWWMRPSTHDRAGVRRRALARAFDRASKTIRGMPSYELCLHSHFPEVEPAQMAVLLAEGSPLPHSNHLLSQDVEPELVSGAFRLRCSPEIWRERGREAVDRCEAMEVSLRCSLANYARIAEVLISPRSLEQLKPALRVQGLLPNRWQYFRETHSRSPFDARGGYRQYVRYLVAVIAGQVLFFESIMPTMLTVDRAIGTADFLDLVRDTYGDEVATPILGVLSSAMRLKGNVVPLAQDAIDQLRAILGLSQRDTEVAELSRAIFAVLSAMTRDGTEASTATADWMLDSDVRALEEWELRNPDKVRLI